ncbi:uncharacterized protein LOC124927282 [Impatiens glandulifera]|uniref:uncharacterized protein LOC124927282 n=1 Tax=Impatiens glandulifera TaxID=253017 RepID=UPI001FB0FDFF|nr:uncharacterized protein LOC124927282 [Impatiens glandulifera]
MFASQLLRILQTVPSQVNNETRASDLDPMGQIMKDNGNRFQSNTNIYENDSDSDKAIPIREQKEEEDVGPIREKECAIAPLGSKLIKQEAFLNTPELEHSVIEEVFISDGKYSRGQNEAREMDPSRSDENESSTKVQLRDSVVPDGNNPFIGTGLFENKTDLYVEKDIPGCELPELVVCYKDSTSYGVKDICVRIEDSSKDQNSIETGDENTVLQSLTPLGDDNKNLTPLNSSLSNNQAVDTDESGTKEKMDDICTPESDFGTSTAEVRCSSNPFVEDVADMSGEMISQEGTYFLEEFGKQKSLNPFLDSVDSNGDDVELQSDQVRYSEATSESGRTSPVNKLSYNSKVEKSTIIFDFNSKAGGGGGGSGSRSPDNHLKAQRTGVDGSHQVPTDLNHVRGGDRGESSFGMNGSVSGLITYTGSIANSCNTSLRSDSSATSTRSFAFPILNAEWNSSPIRMAKGDKRLLRKHKGWRQGLLCCRF